jgi:negative regulator of flagellin synthesis FlgM
MSYTNGITNQQQVLSSLNSSAVQPGTTEDSVSEASVSPSQSAERADLTSLSATAGLVAQSLGGSDVRSEKVASLQQAIGEGSYNVSSSAVADKIMQSLLE